MYVPLILSLTFFRHDLGNLLDQGPRSFLQLKYLLIKSWTSSVKRGVCLKLRPGKWSKAFRSHRAQTWDGRNGQAEIETPANLPLSIFYSKRGKRRRLIITGSKKHKQGNTILFISTHQCRLSPPEPHFCLKHKASILSELKWCHQLCVHWMTLSHASFLI